jgi:hypothetical protein
MFYSFIKYSLWTNVYKNAIKHTGGIGFGSFNLSSQPKLCCFSIGIVEI